MNQKIKQLLAIGSLAVSLTAFADQRSNNHFIGHNFSNNQSRELVQLSKAWCDGGMGEDGWFGTFWVAGEYQGSFKNDKKDGLGSMFSFGGSETNEMTVGGGTNAGTSFNIDGYQLGLGNGAAGSTQK